MADRHSSSYAFAVALYHRVPFRSASVSALSHRGSHCRAAHGRRDSAHRRALRDYSPISSYVAVGPSKHRAVSRSASSCGAPYVRVPPSPAFAVRAEPRHSERFHARDAHGGHVFLSRARYGDARAAQRRTASSDSSGSEFLNGVVFGRVRGSPVKSAVGFVSGHPTFDGA